MNVRESYNEWSLQYDTNLNKTRDLESIAIKEVLRDINFDSCLEIGCGTGKNTIWLITKAKHLTGVDLSDGMLAVAREKIKSSIAEFIQADITQLWKFNSEKYDLITFSLVLEHIEDLGHIFSEASKKLNAGGYLYLGELHPFKQYTGSKARFDSGEGVHVVECYTHNISDFVAAAQVNRFSLVRLNEYFDDKDEQSIPRLLTILFKKN
ncbi:MAG: class I SAM-dependent methyltransferase [Bacteroidetes bacterium]|nr:class I SAM-dependent methyltransferase [Bacteroidota bacterium]